MSNLKNYRIKKVTNGYGETKYYLQHKFYGLLWDNMCVHSWWDASYETFEEAQSALCNFLKKPVVEYLEVNCGETK